MDFTSIKQASDDLEAELIDLLTQCKLGDQKAFSVLYQKTSNRLNGIAYRITRRVDSANEVLQEAFIQIWQNRDSFQAEKGKAFTWLASIVRYRAYDRLRYDKRRHQDDHVEFDESDSLDINVDEINQHSQSIGLGDHSEQALNNCLSKLEKKQSQSILMAYMYGYSRDDISNYFNTPVNTVKSWIRRGLGRLQQCLSE
jgi:RNA polymerase sigma-70 factor (ECF subfamily)